MTAGDLGIPQNSDLKPVTMAEIRKSEASKAATFLKASLTILSFHDLHLPFIPIENLIKEVLPIIRAKQTDAIFSFHPHETTKSFDHPDHNVAGMVSKYVGAAADVKHFMPESQALKTRPELYLWSSKKNQNYLAVHQSRKIKQQRNQYLIDNYPSQFKKTDQKKWQKIFDQLSENYEKVR